MQQGRCVREVEVEVEIVGDTFDPPRLLIFRPGDRVSVRVTRRTRPMFLGGAAKEGPRFIRWNSVVSRRERIEQAKEDWKTGASRKRPAKRRSFRFQNHKSGKRPGGGIEIRRRAPIGQTRTLQSAGNEVRHSC